MNRKSVAQTLVETKHEVSLVDVASCSHSKNELTNLISKTQYLENFLNKKWEKPRFAHCHFEQLISAVLPHCHSMSYARLLIFNKLSCLQTNHLKGDDMK